MKDSRSPSKVPIMRDGRSPYKENRTQSKRKEELRTEKRPESPREKADIDRDVSPGIRYSPLKNCRVSPDNRSIETPEAKVISPKIDLSRSKGRPRTPSEPPCGEISGRTPSPGRRLSPMRSERAKTPPPRRQ